MPLPNMIVTGNLKEILGDVVSDELVESAMTRARIEFVSNLPTDVLVKWSASLYRVDTIKAIVDTDGEIVNVDGEPVRLLAQDDGLNVRGLQWQVRIALPSSAVPPLIAENVRAWWFNAAADGETVNLKNVVPLVATRPYGVPPGAPPSTVESTDITDSTSVGRAVLTAADAAAARTAIGAAAAGGGYTPGGTDVAVADGGTGASSASAARANLGLIIGTDVQAYDADLATLASLTATTNNFIVSVGSAWASRTPTQVKTTLAITQADVSDIAQVTPNRRTSSYTLALTDAGKAVEMNVASANDLTVPPNSSVAFPTNTVIEVDQYGAGQTTVVAGAGVTIRSRNGLKLAGQYAGASLRKIGADEWWLIGDTTT